MIITGTVVGGLLITNIITAYLLKKKTIESSVDSLTKVYNRRQFDNDYFHTPSRRKTDRTCLILIDVNDFKQINDTKGHAEGDRVLAALAQYLVESVRADDRVYRIGGDEFAILTHSLNSVKRLKENNHVCSISVGYALTSYRDKKQTFEDADQMLYDVKLEHKNLTK